MQSTIVIFFSAPEKLGYPFDDPLYYRSYHQFADFCSERGQRIIFARGLESYLANMEFARGWQFQGGELLEVQGPIHADVIVVKGRDLLAKLGPNDLAINDPQFELAASNKWLTYQAFPALMPRTAEITNENWRSVVDSITTQQIVLKPMLGFGGKGILITETASLDFPALNIEVPYLAQEFIDSSAGIPGLCTGIHDLRIILFAGQPALSFIRQPKTGSLLSNVSQGGSLSVVDIRQVPESIMRAVRSIDATYTKYPFRVYTADFCMSGGRPYLIETNPQPGFPTTEPAAFRQQFFQQLHATLNLALTASRKGAHA